MFTTQEIITAIENHTCLFLAAAKEEPALVVERLHHITGMIELARRLPVAPELLASLEHQRERLRDRLAGTVCGAS